MTIEVLKCKACGYKIEFNNGIATCASCGTVHTTDNEFPVPGGSIKTVIPLIIAIGQSLRKLDQLIGQCSNQNNTYGGTEPDVKLQNNHCYLTILKTEQYEDTEEHPGFLSTKYVPVTLTRHIKICYIQVKKSGVVFFVQGEEYMPEMEKLAQTIAPQLNCGISVILDIE